MATTSGLATFEHEGTVSGSQELVLSVPEAAMDDLLQSLVLQDLDGGTVRPVRYAARDALGRVLASYAFDLRETPGLAELLAQARGEELIIDGPSELRGTLLSVERVDEPDEAPAWFLTLVHDRGLTRLPLADVRSVRFEDEALQDELNAALAALARDRGANIGQLRIRFEGVGERRVRVAYVREMPVWKTSYRLVVGDDGSAELQGWAILDNPTDMDLNDVQVTFLAGQPISFVTELFGPVYVDRPRVSVDTGPQIVPEADAGALDGAQAESAFAPAPSAARAADGVAMMAAPAAPELRGAGVEAAATGQRTASAYAYRVDEPVTVGRHASAMVPIVQATLPATRLTVVDPELANGAPLRAVRIENDSGALLAAGTVTLYDEAGFAGNARLADLAPGGERLLRYAGDLGVRVGSERETTPERVVSVRIDGGLLRSEVRHRAITRYRIARDDDEPRLLVIEHPAPDGWTVASPSPDPVRTEDAWRFGVALGDAEDGAEENEALPVQLRCDGEEACVLEVALERTESQTTQITNLSSDRIAVLLQNVELDPADREALTRIAELQRRVAQLDAAIADQQRRRDDIHREQDRIRENMQVLERNSSLYRRYLSDLEAQEDELDVVLTAIEGFRSERTEATTRLNDAIRALPER
ncbi:MAG: hypothetical protein U5J97_11100 [Trueperaceae bacterium]|nr:hypothetical protein [Trueperaceae bacterium]